jgi:glyoxylase-like metal-dependent hydrolase (beta-lactamase superfamily II)
MIQILDLNFLSSKQTIAAFLVPSEEGFILFETGPYSTFKELEKELNRCGTSIENIKHVFITHIHFDHAGAAWALAAQGADIYLHPVGKKHMHDPSRLYQSAKRIYQDKMDYLWGKMEGIPEAQLKTVEHEAVIQIGGVSIKALHTPGHASHHVAWKIGDEIIVGDVGGVKINNGVVVAPCPPPDIDVALWQQSIQLLSKENASALYLTHFGKITNVDTHLKQLEQQLLDWANWMKLRFEQGIPQEQVTPEFQCYVREQLIASGVTINEELEKYEKANPAWMSVAGLMRYWEKQQQ